MASFDQRRPPRSRMRRRAAPFALLLACAGSIGSACSSDSAPRGGTTLVGNADRADNGALAIDEPNLRGAIEDGTLTVSVPVTSLLDRPSQGKLQLRLLSVDGTRELGTVELPYALGPQETATLTAALPAPAGVTTQGELVNFNVRVDDNTPSGLRVTRSLLYVVPLYELRVEGPATLRKGRQASYRVRTDDALRNQPLEGQEVTFELMQDGEVQESHVLMTETTGDATVSLQPKKAGDFQVRARMTAQGTQTLVADAMRVEDSKEKLLLTTDKPIYQPGQIINLRALSLSRDGNKPVSDAQTTFEIEDGKGNKIFKKTVTTDEHGISFTRFKLGGILNEGTFKVRVLGGAVTSEKTINVSHYALPKFQVSVTTEDPWYAPGATIRGVIDSRYFFGKPVTGEVLVEGYSIDVGTTLFQTVMGSLNADGHYEFSLALPETLPGLPLGQGNAAIELRVSVTDSAGQKVEKSTLVTVSAQGASVALVPESTAIVPGVENQLLLFATDPLGTPLPNAQVTLSAPDGARLTATTDDFGQAELAWTPPGGKAAAARAGFQAVIALEGGKSVATTFDFTTQVGAEHLILRTDKSVYEVGETVKVEVISTAAEGRVYVDWSNDGQTVDMRTLTTEAGRAKFATTIDIGLSGSNRIEAYLVDADGQIVRTGRTIFARTGAALNVEVSADQEVYEPGQPAKLTLQVSDETGAPAVAALGVQIVDQAVFALVDAKPGLLRSYFEIDDKFSVPEYELHAPAADFTSLLFTETTSKNLKLAQAAQQRTSAALAAMKNTSLTGIQRGSLQAVLQEAREKLQPAYALLKSGLEPELNQLVAQAQATLNAQGCTASKPICQGGSFAELLGKDLANAFVAYDFWGNAFDVTHSYDQVTLTGAGPDERQGSEDDTSLVFSLAALGGLRAGGPEAPDQAAEPGAAPGNAAAGGGAATGSPLPESDNSAETGPRVRTDFPETLYVNPSIITDASGKASIDVGMADSITEWRVSALANSADGRLGGSESGIRVFQDFFVDVNFPATLSRGDEVTFPVAVYNYLDVSQVVSVELSPGSWYTPLGSTTASVPLEPGQVTGISFPVRVDEVGLRTLTVVATGDKKSDAVARTVRVVPDGKAFPQALSGSMSPGVVNEAVTFPVSAVPGSAQLYLDVFPAFLAQAVQGMDSILAEPSGCFEQTTSSAWPNVLVTEYLSETDQLTPEIEIKAEALMSAGYQRLLTFEHPGGGFSWFGEQDPAPFLSVTAFGLMEFSDMARVHPVDEAMLGRTLRWLLLQQQPDGSFKGDMSEFFSFHTSEVRNTAFTAWALASAGETGNAVQQALAYVKANLGSSDDAFTLGIVANALVAGAPGDPELDQVFALLDNLKKTDGEAIYWDSGDTQTNFYAAGNDAAVASTALVAHALLGAGGHPALADGALKYLTSKKDSNGNFGSTQATIWTLRTLVLAARKGTSGAIGNLSVSVDSNLVKTLALTKAQSDVMTRIDLSSLASTGSHDVSLSFIGSGRPSYNLVASHHLPWALVPAEPLGPLSISVNYDKETLFVDDIVEATVTLTNNEPVTQNMVLLTLGIPPGFSVDTSELQQRITQGTLSKFELTGRQLILYVSALAPSATETFHYALQATMPVTAVDGGAEARLYYEPEKRSRAPGRAMKVAQP